MNYSDDVLFVLMNFKSCSKNYVVHYLLRTCTLRLFQNVVLATVHMYIYIYIHTYICTLLRKPQVRFASPNTDALCMNIREISVDSEPRRDTIIPVFAPPRFSTPVWYSVHFLSLILVQFCAASTCNGENSGLIEFRNFFIFSSFHRTFFNNVYVYYLFLFACAKFN